MEKNIIDAVNDERHKITSCISDLNAAAEKIENDFLLENKINVQDSDILQVKNFEQDINVDIKKKNDEQVASDE